MTRLLEGSTATWQPPSAERTSARPVASVATRTISEFTSLRKEMRKTAERVPAGV